MLGGSFVAAQLGQDGVETVVALLGLSAVPLDPLGHQVEDLRFEMARPPLGVFALADQAGVGQHLDVLGHGLDGDVVGISQLPDRGVAHGEASHDVAPRRIGESTEDSGQLVVGHRRAPSSTEWLNTPYAAVKLLSTTWLRMNSGRRDQLRHPISSRTDSLPSKR